jgi:HK97 family phage prohead protease
MQIVGVIPMGVVNANGRMLMPGCFDDYLRDGDVWLCLDHCGEKRVADTKDGTLDVWRNDRNLMFLTKLKSGPYAAEAVRAIQQGICTGASPCWKPITATHEVVRGQTVKVIHEARLDEVSILTQGQPATPGTRVLLHD